MLVLVQRGSEHEVSFGAGKILGVPRRRLLLPSWLGEQTGKAEKMEESEGGFEIAG
jgi:hypothetical protein